PQGSTLIPLILTSDETHLTNFNGDVKLWPIYLSIGNIPSHIRNAPSTHAFHLLALLPRQPKVKLMQNKEKKERLDMSDSVLQDVLTKIFEPICTPDIAKEGVLIPCSDGFTRRCFPVVCSWLADLMEKTKILGLMHGACPNCEVHSKQFGEYPKDGTREAPR